MRQELTEAPNEIPIIYVLITLGFISFLATFILIDFHYTSSNAIMAAGLISGICALPLGFKLGDAGSADDRVPARCTC